MHMEVHVDEGEGYGQCTSCPLLDPHSYMPIIHNTSVTNEERKLPQKVQAGSKEMTNAPVPIR